MKIVTSVTVFNDAVGKRMSVTYSEVDNMTGKVISDNNRFDRVLTDNDVVQLADELKTYAQEIIDSAE